MSSSTSGEYGAQHTDYVLVPSNKCGLIIGKGGETIKQINQSTGAHCEIDKNAPPDSRDKVCNLCMKSRAVKFSYTWGLLV